MRRPQVVVLQRSVMDGADRQQVCFLRGPWPSSGWLNCRLEWNEMEWNGRRCFQWSLFEILQQLTHHDFTRSTATVFSAAFG